MNYDEMPRWGRETKVYIEPAPHMDGVTVRAHYRNYAIQRVCPAAYLARVLREALDELAREVGRAAVMA